MRTVLLQVVNGNLGFHEYEIQPDSEAVPRSADHSELYETGCPGRSIDTPCGFEGFCSVSKQGDPQILLGLCCGLSSFAMLWRRNATRTGHNIEMTGHLT